MPECTLCHEEDGKFTIAVGTPAQVGPICRTCRNTILGPIVTADKLKVVWSAGFNNWHHDFDITSPIAVGQPVIVVHVTKESMDELLDADRLKANKVLLDETLIANEVHHASSTS